MSTSAPPASPPVRPWVAALAAVGTLLVLVVALVAGQRWVPSSAPLDDAPRRVLLVGLGPMAFGDLGSGSTPTIDALLEGAGAAGAMSTRTAARGSTLEEGYLSLGAGARVQADSDAGIVYDAAELAALPDPAPTDPAAAPGPLLAVGADASVERNRGRTVPSGPGALADALHDAGRTIAVVGNADVIDPTTGSWLPRRPAALAAMGSDRRVDAGVVSRGALLVEAPTAPFGVHADVEAVASAALGLLEVHDVVIVDPGDLARVERWQATTGDAAASTPAAVEAARDGALARTDEVLGRLLATVPDDVLVLGVSIDAGGSGFHLTPTVVAGTGVAPGGLVSPSTKRAGLLAITDVAPTVLDAVGVAVPDGMPGHAVQYRPGNVDVDHLEALDRDTAFREATYGDWVRWFITASAAAYGAALIVILSPADRPRLRRFAEVGALLSAGFPLATFLFRAVPGSAGLDGLGIAAVVALDVALVAAARRFRRTPLQPLQVVMAATVGVILLDTCLGTPLHVNSWLGYSLHGGGRFYGIPNTTYALLGAGAILLVASMVGRARRPREALLVGAGLLATVIVIDGAPGLGGDVGGIVSFTPVFGVLLLLLLGRRLRPRRVLAIGAGTALLLGAATALDLARPERSRTHLGRFAARVGDDGFGEVVDTFLRKQEANLRILEVSTWVRMVVLLAVVLAVLLGPRARRVALTPPGSATAIGTGMTLVAAVVGFLTNDSGPIVIGLFATFLLPFVVLPALDPSGPGSEPADLLAVGLEPVAGDGEGGVVDRFGDRGRVG